MGASRGEEYGCRGKIHNRVSYLDAEEMLLLKHRIRTREALPSADSAETDRQIPGEGLRLSARRLLALQIPDPAHRLTAEAWAE
jgi:hypothetical protein